jgi:hypothetical protein
LLFTVLFVSLFCLALLCLCCLVSLFHCHNSSLLTFVC